MNRRTFIKQTSRVTAGLSISALSIAHLSCKDEVIPYKISLAEWSLHRALFDKKMDNLDFAITSKNTYEIDAVEYVNQFFKNTTSEYLNEVKNRADSVGVKNLLIMCDGEGRLGDPDENMRNQAVENHIKWLEAAKFLGCHSIRVNAASSGSYEEQKNLAADGLRKLSERGDGYGLNVIVENHGGLSSDGKWLSSVIKAVDHPGCGTLPDFGNFRVSDQEEYDRYQGVQELMPFAKAVSAKSHDFDDQGDETRTNYFKMMQIVLDAGYHGYVGIEYEGSQLAEHDGIIATKRLLEKVRTEIG
jgi:sugar phosphate isomerase/epimerase